MKSEAQIPHLQLSQMLQLLSSQHDGLGRTRLVLETVMCRCHRTSRLSLAPVSLWIMGRFGATLLEPQTWDLGDIEIVEA